MSATRLYLMRHATAEEGDPMDADREITLDGRGNFKNILALASDAGAEPQAILCSPFDRGKDSAMIAADFFGVKKITVSPNLVPDALVDKAWLDVAGAFDKNDEVLVVCHQPLLGQLVNRVFGTTGLQVKFKTCSMMRIDFDADQPSTSTPAGMLRWFITPKIAPGTLEEKD
jgi:phosphohistidine phosphatase SixA